MLSLLMRSAPGGCCAASSHLPVMQSLQAKVHAGQDDISPRSVDVRWGAVVLAQRQAAHVLKLQAGSRQQVGNSETVQKQVTRFSFPVCGVTVPDCLQVECSGLRSWAHHLGSGDSSVVKAPVFWLKGLGV